MIFDLQGAQSIDYRDRGVARYVVELALALERRAPERMVAYVLNPDLALPGGIEPLVASGKLRFVDEVVYGRDSMLHVASPFELSVGIDRLFPPAARRAGVRMCVTVFDLIQLSMPETYLEDAGLRRRYLSRAELVRIADDVITISEHVASEVSDRLGVDRRRITATSLAPSAAFRPPASRDQALSAAMAAVPGLASSFVLYTGGSDGRKNIEGLLEGWALLAEECRRSWQLVVAGALPPLRRHHLEVMATSLGFGDGFLCTDFVTEETLVALNQSAGLFAFPSLAEGFGLPVAEALACGTPAIGGDNTSIVELLPDEARFDATSPWSIAAALTRALTDGEHRRRLVEVASSSPHRSWDDVADETLAAYDRPMRPARRTSVRPSGQERFRMAFSTPLPPQPGGVSVYSQKLVRALRQRCEVDVYVDGPPHHRSEVLSGDGRPLSALERVEALQGRYDAVVYSLGNSEFHTGSLAALLRRPGVVLAHDVRLTNLYRFAAWQHPDAAPGGFAATLRRMYEDRLPADLGSRGWLTDDEIERWGLLMARDAIAAATRFATTSPFAAELARLDARPEHRHRVTSIPFGLGGGADAHRASPAREGATPVIASFGVLNRSKQGPLLVRAFAALGPTARLVFVGPAGDDEVAEISAAAAAEGVERRVEIVGSVDDATYRQRLAETTVAVQLRSTTNGESSAAVGDCLSAGLPTVVTGVGSNRSLPDEAVVRVGPDVDATTLGGVLTDLLRSEDRRRSLALGARRHAAAHSFDVAADALYRLVSSPA